MNDNGYTQINVKKGVLLTTGGYSANPGTPMMIIPTPFVNDSSEYVESTMRCYTGMSRIAPPAASSASRRF